MRPTPLRPTFAPVKSFSKIWAEGAKDGRKGAKPFMKLTPVFLQTSTTEDGGDEHAGKKFVVFFHHNTKRDGRERGRNSWPEGRGKFLHFVMHKVDGDSTTIFEQLRPYLFPNSHKTECKFKIAGLKDRYSGDLITWRPITRLHSG